MLGNDIETLNYDNLEAVAHLAGSERYIGIMQVRNTCVHFIAFRTLYSVLCCRLLIHNVHPQRARVVINGKRQASEIGILAGRVSCESIECK